MTLSEGDLMEYNPANHSEQGEKPEIELLDKNVLDLLLQNYSLSATHLNSYLRCQINFYLRVSSAKNETACFGTAVTMRFSASSSVSEKELLLTKQY
jgi:DNA helicase II / ATP-dependent DNA helicase PcrA